MSKLRIILGILLLYSLTLVWGYIRLPLSGIKHLRSYSSIANAPAVSIGPLFDVSEIQEWYLKRAFSESPVPVVPTVSVEVKWYALIFARTSASYYASPKGAEWRDTMSFCLFGMWIPVYTFSHKMA